MLFEALVTLLAQTHTTFLAAKLFGARHFLPSLFVKRFSLLGGIDEAAMVRQLDACTSFNDDKWATYWMNIANEHIHALDGLLYPPGDRSFGRVYSWAFALESAPPPELQLALARGAPLLITSPFDKPIVLQELIKDTPSISMNDLAIVDAMLKAITYSFVAAWPGRTPKRNNAYKLSLRLSDCFVDGVISTLGWRLERHMVLSGEDAVMVHALLPSSLQAGEKLPAVLVATGLEGTNQEVMIPLLRCTKPSKVAYFFVEMPGTYLFKALVSPPMVAERIYSDVLTLIASHESTDGKRIGMMGLSFGAYWTTRMTLLDKRIVAAVINGPPLYHSFKLWSAFGVPEIMVKALANATGARHPLDLLTKLGSLSLSKSTLQTIECPILVINGSCDTLVSTQDSVDLAEAVPDARIELYANDDHCAMSHYAQWLRLSIEWLQETL